MATWGGATNSIDYIFPPSPTHRSRPQLSLLTFRGQMAVHGLFDFLLEACGSSMGGGVGGGGFAQGSTRGGGGGGRGGDVPLLLSREPFLNASLKALKVRAVVLMMMTMNNDDGYDDDDDAN